MTATDSLLNYGLAGIITVAIVIPMAIYILRDKDRQLKEKDGEIVRLRGELADLRRVLDPIAPAMTKMGETVKTAIDVISNFGRHL